MAKADKPKNVDPATRPQYPKWVVDPNGKKDKNGFPERILVQDEAGEKAVSAGKKQKADGGWG